MTFIIVTHRDLGFQFRIAARHIEAVMPSDQPGDTGCQINTAGNSAIYYVKESLNEVLAQIPSDLDEAEVWHLAKARVQDVRR